MTQPTPPTPTPPSASTSAPVPPGVPARSRGVFSIVVVALSIAAVAAAAWILLQPTLVFSNGLVAPVRLVIGQTTRIVAPGETVRIRVSRTLLVAQWELDRPLSADRQPMGETVRGSWVVPAPRGRLTRAAGPRLETGDYFAPLVTNETNRLLRITVNAGLDGALDCGCAVRPGARRVFLGYYRLYRNSTVQATDPDDRTATFRDLGPEAQARNWVVGLRFTGADFGKQENSVNGER
jgi:hypothetical protein